jgi:hypothetical protein
MNKLKLAQYDYLDLVQFLKQRSPNTFSMDIYIYCMTLFNKTILTSHVVSKNPSYTKALDVETERCIHDFVQYRNFCLSRRQNQTYRIRAISSVALEFLEFPVTSQGTPHALSDDVSVGRGPRSLVQIVTIRWAIIGRTERCGPQLTIIGGIQKIAICTAATMDIWAVCGKLSKNAAWMSLPLGKMPWKIYFKCRLLLKNSTFWQFCDNVGLLQVVHEFFCFIKLFTVNAVS